MPKAHRDPARAGGTYDPNGPFTGNPHDDRPEVVTKQPAVTDDTEVTQDATAYEAPDPNESRDVEGEVPARADEIEPWVDAAGDDRTERARRIGAALNVERARPTPRTTVMSKLEGLQADLNRHDDRF
jgi:hypothetical protein